MKLKKVLLKEKIKNQAKRSNIFFVYINLTKLQKCDKI